MKIILEAFGKLKSDPMDVPEDTGLIFKLVLTQPITAISNYYGDDIGSIKKFNTICEFEYVGKSYAYKEFNARIYVLRDIVKI